MLISADRYLMVKMKLGYRTFMNRWKAGFSIVFTWVTSLMLFAVPLIGFDALGPGSWVNYSVTCDAAVLYFLPYSIVAFNYVIVIPGCLLLFFNLRLFLNIRKRSGGLIRSRQVAPLNTVADQLQEHFQPSQSKDHVSEFKGTETMNTNVSAMNNKTFDPVIQANSEHDHRDAVDHKPRNDVTLTGYNGNRDAIDGNREAVALAGHAGHSRNRDSRTQQDVAIKRAARKNRWALKRDKKAATTLSVLVLIFLICWLPYCVTNVIYLLDHFVSLTVWNAVYYLVWLNSGLNPCLYAITSPKFRKNFLDLLCIWKRYCKPR